MTDRISDETRKAVEDRWEGRVAAMGFPTKTSKRYLEAQAHFFAGAMTALGIVDPAWTIAIMTGRDIIGERERIERKVKAK